MEKRIFTIFLTVLLLSLSAIPVSAAQMSSRERQAAQLINQRRADHGLAPLEISPALSEKARAKAADMRENQYFDHNSPVHGSPFAMMKDMGVSYSSAGENIAMGYDSPRAVVDAWMRSPSHRAAILSETYTQFGIGEVDGYWAQWFVTG